MVLSLAQCEHEPGDKTCTGGIGAVQVHKLLRPHFRYTIEINQRARTALIEAGGVLEGLFTPNRYTMEMTAVAYDLTWRFDQQGLPRDLLTRSPRAPCMTVHPKSNCVPSE